MLLILANAPERRLRMSDLAAAVVLSQSGLTRLVDRLVLAGSVERTRCETDRRGLNAELTAAGRARLAEARPTHLAGVRGPVPRPLRRERARRARGLLGARAPRRDLRLKAERLSEPGHVL